jgi:hypothetical protein
MGEVRYWSKYVNGQSALWFESGRPVDVAYRSTVVLRVDGREERRVVIGGNASTALLDAPLGLRHWTVLELVAVEQWQPPKPMTPEERRAAELAAFLDGKRHGC